VAVVSEEKGQQQRISLKKYVP